MTQTHVLTQLSDYVLGLLAEPERQAVARHTAVCPSCRLALQQEAGMATAVHHTIHTATAPPPRRLAQLMPQPPVTKRPFGKRAFTWPWVWQRQLAPLALVMFLAIAGLGWHLTSQSGVWTNPSATFFAATATMTDTPTVTLVKTEAAQTQPAFTAVATLAARPDESPAIGVTPPGVMSPGVTPAPIPTPRPDNW